MATAKPDLPRDGTMQVTAKEGIDYLKSAGKDTLLEMQGLKEPEASSSKTSVARDSTMQATAKEAEDYILAGSKFDPDATTRGQQKKVEEIAEEKAASAKKPRMSKGVTMAATAKEAKGLLADTNIDPDATTRGQQKKMDEIADESVTPTKKPRMSKGVTMAATAKEAKVLLAGGAPDQDAMTRGQQKKIEDIHSEKPSPKKPKMSKNTTMAATAKEGAALLGAEKLGDTRTKSKGKPAGPKRSSTIQKTVDEAKWVLQSDKVDISEGRKTRSASNPKPPPAVLKKAGTMQKTAKEGKEFLKRGRKQKKAAEEIEEEEEEES